MGCGASVSEPVNNQVITTANTSSRPAVGRQPQIHRRHAPLTPASIQGSYSHGRRITAQQLEQERNQFWESRVGGSIEMWQALRTCAEACHQGDLQLANAILEASNLSTPSGTLEVCYDERGYEYAIPNYCRLSPNELTANLSNISQSQAQTTPTSKSKSSKDAGDKKNSQAPLPVATPVPLTVRVRINPGEYNVKLTNLTTNDSILDLKNFISSLNSTSTATAGGDKEEVGEKLVTAAVECLPPKGQKKEKVTALFQWLEQRVLA